MFLTAKQIHNGLCWLPEGSVVEVADDGVILSVSDTPNAEATFYAGILAPGFVNVHCHLELSHMKGLVPEHTGLIPFLKNIPLHRNDFTDEQKKAARRAAYDELLANGVVAVGDIVNTTESLDLRALDQLHYHTFVESLGFNDANAGKSFNYALGIYDRFVAQEPGSKILKQAIVPHAPYSVSASLFRLIDQHRPDAPVSIHNQESEEENRYYETKEGMVQDLIHALGIDDHLFQPTGKTSIQSYLEWMSLNHPYIFVHNTYSTANDVQYAQSRDRKAYWCLCPNANLYIENRLPDIEMLIREGAGICIGTDSLASNHQLSVVAELHTIKVHYPGISWDTLLTWATYNGADALQMKDTLGSIEPGKTPGIVQLTGFDSGGSPAVKRII